MKPPISTRFSWLLGDIGLIDASFSPIILSYCMDHFHEIKIPNFERVIAREAKTCAPDFPKGREAEVIDLLLEFYHNPKMIVTTRKYAKAALDKIADKYPEIRNEFE
ncbi:MAG: hypothetical protein GYB31_12640 [Bacteroidetes bacterium]|nr:hypothetical protein [Bacteroidota bacterium]